MKEKQTEAEKMLAWKVHRMYDRELKQAIKNGEPERSQMRLYINRADALANLGRSEEAIADFKAAAKLDPASHKPHEELGNLLMRLGRYEEAKFCHDRALAIHPSVASYNGRATANIHLRKAEEALKDCEAALALKPKDLGALILSAQANLTLKRLDKTRHFCERALAIAPQNTVALFFRSQCHDQPDRNKRALADLEQCVAHGFASDAVFTNKSLALLHLERFEEALADTDMALQINANSEGAWVNKTNVLNKLGRYHQSIDCGAKAQAIFKNNQNKAKLLLNVALAHTRLGQIEEALKTYLSAIAADNTLAMSYNNRACILGHLGRFAEADKDIQRASHLQPDSAVILGSRGLINFGLGKNEDAIADLTRATTLNPADGESHFFLGLALRKANDEEGALRHLAEAQALKCELPKFSVYMDRK